MARGALHNFQVIKRGSRAAFRCGHLRSGAFRDLAGSFSLSPARERDGGAGRRTSGEEERERDAYVSFLIVTGSTLRYRPEERPGPCHYYPIISCITVTANEVSYYAAYRGGGRERKEEKGELSCREERRAARRRGREEGKAAALHGSIRSRKVSVEKIGVIVRGNRFELAPRTEKTIALDPLGRPNRARHFLSRLAIQRASSIAPPVVPPTPLSHPRAKV